MTRQKGPANSSSSSPRVFMMDLWATVPYYTAYLSRALLSDGANVQVGSITYYLDRDCFRGRAIKLDPGCSDVVGQFPRLPKVLRRVLKLAEGLLNLAALAIRFAVRPPDVVHVQFLPMLRSSFPVDLWFVRFCRWRGARIVLTVHDLLPHDTEERFKELYANLYVQMDALICHSDHIKARLEREFGIASSKIYVIPHGPFFFDLPVGDRSSTLSELGVQQGQQMVLWQGIIFPYKGLDLLLNAWREVENQTSNLALVALGTGAPDLTAALEQQAHDLGLKNIHFHFRFCSAGELVAAYRAATMVVYPYRAITTSGALATGLALGKPIVASDLPVFRELLINDQSALLIDPLSPKGLAGAILALADDPARRERLASEVLAMRFGAESWKSIARKTSDLYLHLLTASPTTR